jgi:hypothetical protein
MGSVSSVDLRTVVARSDKLLHTDVDGDVTMINVDTGKYYAHTSVGARIWSLLDQPRSAGEVCDRLMAEYRVDRPRCEDEVVNFLRKMAEEGVVVTVPPTAS